MCGPPIFEVTPQTFLVIKIWKYAIIEQKWNFHKIALCSLSTFRWLYKYLQLRALHTDANGKTNEQLTSTLSTSLEVRDLEETIWTRSFLLEKIIRVISTKYRYRVLLCYRFRLRYVGFGRHRLAESKCFENIVRILIPKIKETEFFITDFRHCFIHFSIHFYRPAKCVKTKKITLSLVPLLQAKALFPSLDLRG